MESGNAQEVPVALCVVAAFTPTNFESAGKMDPVLVQPSLLLGSPSRSVPGAC